MQPNNSYDAGIAPERPDMADWWHKVCWHLPFNWYCNLTLPGWGWLQVQMHNACTRYEERRAMEANND